MRFLVFQHLPVEHPGVFRDFWRAAGVEVETVELDAGDPIPSDLTRYDALVVMGGPMDVWETEKHHWLVPEIVAIRRFAVMLERPYLGVCLGHQLLALALGGEVKPAAASEVGPCDVRLTDVAQTDPLFAGLPSPLTTFQWHSAEVTDLPEQAVVLAETDLCGVQAFRWGQHAYGTQFHAEVTPQTVGEWGAEPAYARSLEEALGVGALAYLDAQTAELLPSFHRTAAQLSDRFLALIRAARELTQDAAQAGGAR